MRVRMADGYYGMAAVEIKILRALPVIDMAATAPYGLDRIQRIYIEWFHLLFMF